MPVQRRYWDACAFLGYLSKDGEEEKKDQCESVLRHAAAGKILIVTSYITYTEVIKLKGKTPIPQDQEQVIADFFENEYIVPRIVDRQIAELARKLIWDHNVKPKDAIHAATAVKLKIAYLDTFDGDLIALNGKIGSPQVLIAEPPLLGDQTEIEFDGSDEPDTSDDDDEPEDEETD